MANSVDPDQTAPSGAVWSGSALFAYAILSATLVYKILGHLPQILGNAGPDKLCVAIYDIWSGLQWLAFIQQFYTHQ